MSLVSDFLGSVFGLGYIGYKLLQEKQERDVAKCKSEFAKRFADKYCDKELEEQFARMVEDPAQTEKVWEIIVDFVRRTDPHNLFLPIKMLDTVYFLDRKKYPTAYGWQEIEQNIRVPFHDKYGRINVKDDGEFAYLYRNREIAITFLLMSRGKVYWGGYGKYVIEIVWKEIDEVGFKEFERKYLLGPVKVTPEKALCNCLNEVLKSKE